MIADFTVVFKSARNDHKTVLAFTEDEYNLGLLKAKASDIIKNGLYVKKGNNHTYISPSDVDSVTWVIRGEFV